MKQPLGNLQDIWLCSEFKHSANTPSEQMQAVGLCGKSMLKSIVTLAKRNNNET